MPKVSIVIPTFNRGSVIERTLSSILAQTYADYEIIVVDDGSADDTKQRVAAFGERVRYLYQANKGVSAARNKGIRKARGQYIAFCDSDDLFVPTKLEKQMSYIESNPSCKFLYSWYYKVYQNKTKDEIVRRTNSCKDLNCFRYCLITRKIEVRTSTVIVKKDCFKKVGLFNEGYWKTEDWDMWLRLAKHYLGACIAEPLTVCVRHDKNISRKTGTNFREKARNAALHSYGWKENTLEEIGKAAFGQEEDAPR